MSNIATRHPTETVSPAVYYVAIIIGFVFKPPLEVALAFAGLLAFLPAGVTWLVELRRAKT